MESSSGTNKKNYDVTKDELFSEEYGLKDQIRRAVISIMSTIAEDFERGGNQEFIQFLYIAKASCGEVRSQIYIFPLTRAISMKGLFVY